MDRKGLSIISEVILAIGIIGVAILFSLVATDVISFSRGTFTGSAQSSMIQDITFRIDTIQASSGRTQFTYQPSFGQYTLEARDNNTIELQIEGQDTESATFTTLTVRDVYIEDAEDLCISGDSTTIVISSGECSSDTLDSICDDGCDPTVCQPEYGEDCTAPACTYPDNADAPDASQYCQPGYDPSYIPKDNATVGIGWVNQSFIGEQGQSDRCTQDFECGTNTDGDDLSCNPAAPSAPDPSQSFCCPGNLQWNGTACTNQNTYDVYFIAGYDGYKDTSDYMDRAQTMANSITSRTPFKHCTSKVNTEIFQQTTVPDPNYDLKVTITDEPYSASGSCNAYSMGPGSGFVKVFQLGSAADEMVLPHEMGHEFGLCDEYDKPTYDSQNSDFAGGCGNPWPADKAWYPTSDCSNFDDGGSPTGTCGRDLDDDPSTTEASLMGGGGAWADACGNSLLVSQPGVEPDDDSIDTGYEAWLNEINARGYSCNE